MDTTGYCSPCCGEDYSQEALTECCSAKFIGETDLCADCQEHTCAAEIYACHKCGDWFETPEDAYEYEALREESAMEEKADSKRKYNE